VVFSQNSKNLSKKHCKMNTLCIEIGITLIISAAVALIAIVATCAAYKLKDLVNKCKNRN
jgi:hypothetical protein